MREKSVYSRKAARLSEERVAQLGPFSSVSVALEDPEVPNGEKRLVVTVVEHSSQYLDPRVGFSTGDGLRFAMRGAELAADVALEALEHPEIDAPARLAAARAQAFGTKLGVNRVLRRLVASARCVNAMGAAARMAPGVLRGMIRYAGDVAA